MTFQQYAIMLNEEEYIREIGNQLDLFKDMGDGKYNFRCCVCGDSKKSKFKKRGWFFPTDDGTWIFHCFNCSYTTSFKNFLKEFYPVIYGRYMYDMIANRKKTRHVSSRLVYDDVTDLVLENLLPLSRSKIVHDYILKRQIPESRHDEIHVIKDLSVLKHIQKYKDAKLPKEPRIAMPIFNREGLISGLITRGIVKNSLRYINLSFDDSMMLFGLYDADGNYRIDINKKIYVVEGAFDSMFLTNAVAVNNADLLRITKHFGVLSNTLNFVFIPDADKRNAEVLAGYNKIIKAKRNVVIMPSDIVGKDLNEIVLKNPNINIEDLVESNTHHGLEAELFFKKWKRI